MRVKKRDGRIVDFQSEKIKGHVDYAIAELKGVSSDYILQNFKSDYYYDGIPTSEIQEKIIKVCLDAVHDVEDYSFVASTIAVQNLIHKVYGKNRYPTFKESIEIGIKNMRLDTEFLSGFDLNKIDKFIVPERDRLLKYESFALLKNKYLLKDVNEEIYELPQHMFMGVAMFLASNEKSSEDKIHYAKEYYDAISTMKIMMATPTLSNARTPRSQLSSCYVGAADDNIESIFDSYKEMSLLSKYGGGIGWDWSRIRATNSEIFNKKNSSGGPIPFLKIVNDIAVTVDQLGCVSKDAYVYIKSS